MLQALSEGRTNGRIQRACELINATSIPEGRRSAGTPGALTTGVYGGVIGENGKKGSAVCRSVAVSEEHAARGKRRRVRFRAAGTSLLERSRDDISRTRMRWSITPIDCLNSAEAQGLQRRPPRTGGGRNRAAADGKPITHALAARR